jgi:GGDEF domain-containing protein
LKKSDTSAAGSSCLDEESGLYTPGHFKAALSLELARLDRWERPLSLVLLELPDLAGERGWASFGRLLRASLRNIDLAARLGGHRAAVLWPDADSQRGRRWLVSFLTGLDRDRDLSGRPVTFGRALARPWEGRQTEELLALAAAALGREDLTLTAALEGNGESDDEVRTAIAAEERNLLFAGFQALGASRNH